MPRRGCWLALLASALLWALLALVGCLLWLCTRWWLLLVLLWALALAYGR